ncbi:hypothetical protein CONPUDRAFT_166881 [Coniophora puteana RWD-64-598 SS2]|uniref:Uncharacterized protein n=1 Tax=Coniophora puteana (strain RWD-64-598) TaxID=741705 RepID=A0A5M3MJ82_CONPW|nr:uncharacterized protein CONPUDRAFT_166881 [Coniophora puteana RWD-64-598 SS2]EIW79047.1 hypothetical protein CONPUDRAFT_166881 [Coniophora puteana RWD-64-598 SS2]
MNTVRGADWKSGDGMGWDVGGTDGLGLPYARVRGLVIASDTISDGRRADREHEEDGGSTATGAAAAAGSQGRRAYDRYAQYIRTPRPKASQRSAAGPLFETLKLKLKLKVKAPGTLHFLPSSSLPYTQRGRRGHPLGSGPLEPESEPELGHCGETWRNGETEAQQRKGTSAGEVACSVSRLAERETCSARDSEVQRGEIRWKE